RRRLPLRVRSALPGLDGHGRRRAGRDPARELRLPRGARPGRDVGGHLPLRAGELADRARGVGDVARRRGDRSGRARPAPGRRRMRGAAAAALALAVVAGVACRRGRSFAPIPDDGTFARAAPAPDALARYRLAAAYSRAHAGTALVVVDGDRLVFEEGENGR